MVVGREDQEISLGRLQFELPIRYPSGNRQLDITVWSSRVRLGLEEKKNVSVMSVQIVLKSWDYMRSSME